MQTAAVAADGTVSFTFPSAPNAAYLTTAKSGTGDRTGGTLAATVGLYFQTSSTGGFNPSAYWWSTGRVQVADLASAAQLLSTALTGANWTNYYGQPGDSESTYVVGGTTYPAPAPYFTAAVANVTSWGVSFGGGCHYASGVGTPTGSATFTLLP